MFIINQQFDGGMYFLCKLATCAVLGLICATVLAWRDAGQPAGKIVKIYADPSDVVLVLGKAGPCGSSFFHSKRISGNFKEIVSLRYTAAASKSIVDIVVTICLNDRNIVSDGSAAF